MSLLDIVREIRDQGFNLTKGKKNLSGWTEYRSNKSGPYTVTQYIPDEIYSGYSTGIGTQVTSSAGFSRKGIIVEITDGVETYSEQAFENTDFETQQGISRAAGMVERSRNRDMPQKKRDEQMRKRYAAEGYIRSMQRYLRTGDWIICILVNMKNI